MPDVRLYLLGTLHLTADGRPVILDSPSSALLLAYLAVQRTDGRLVSRFKVAGTFWPDLEEQRARKLLNDLVHRLRKKLDAHDPQLTEALLHADVNTLALNQVWIDIEAFRTNARAAEIADWRAALDLYRGDLLEDSGAAWLVVPRSDLREEYLALLAKACRALANAGSFEEALAYARRWCLADPYNEDAYRASMRLQARLGRHIGALHHYDELVGLLRSELDAAPLPETQRLARVIGAEAEATRSGVTQPRRLIGQGRSLALLIELAERAQEGRGGVVLLEGESGIGKTRLLETLAESAGWRGMRVVWANPEAAGSAGASEYTPIAQMLRLALAGTRGAQARARLPAHVQQQMEQIEVGVAHELGCGYAGGGHWDAAHIANVASEALRALCEATPHLMLLDALQHASPGTWQALNIIATQLEPKRCLLVLCYRDAASFDTTAQQVLRGIERFPVTVRVRLDGLTPEECGELARSLDVRLNPDETLRLYRRTGGNPLYLQALIGDAGTSAAALMQRMLAEQIQPLSASTHEFLAAAAVLGDTWELATWQAVAGEGALDAALLLVERRVMEEMPEGFRFRQDVLGEHLYAALPDEQRFSLHARAAAVFEAQGADAALVAEHLARAGRAREAAHRFGQAAERAGREGRAADAVGYYERALVLLDGVRGAARERTQLEVGRKAMARRTEGRPAAAPLVVKLARADAPYGKRLSDNERVTMRWTVDAGEADDAVARTAGKKALRRRRILRLLTEAADQGAAATDRDLAQTLGVSERTIESDIAALQEAGHRLASRGRPK